MRNVIILISLVWQIPVYASMPVIDAAAIAQIVSVYDQLRDQYKRMKEQLDEATFQSGVLTDQLDSIIGENPFGDIYNSNDDKESRAWAPDSIEEFEDMIQYGFNPGDLADRYAYYQEKFPGTDPETIDPKNSQSSNRELYEYNEEWTKLNLVNFAQTFDTVNASYEKINNLLSEVNTHETLKQSSDFTNRLIGELAYLLQGLIQLENFNLHTKTMVQQAQQYQISSHADFFTFRKK
jgi:hypothetical protein